MAVVFTGLVLLGGWLDGSLTETVSDDKPIQATVLAVLIVVLVVAAQMELAKLVAAKKLKILLPVSIVSSVLFATSAYWLQFPETFSYLYFYLLLVFSLFALIIYHYLRYGIDGIIANCGVSCFSIIYLGVLSSFVLAIRIEFGPWALLMYVFVVKCCDIGAYTTGKLIGRHKFSPLISPGKTWEGMAGGVVLAIIASVIFAVSCDIMYWFSAIIFGVCFAFSGQLGDLAESIIKRDAEQKDSSETVPGFGGILDVIDSPLVTACVAYLFFIITIR